MKFPARYLGGDLPLEPRRSGRLEVGEGRVGFARGFFRRRRWFAPLAELRGAELVPLARVVHLVPWAMRYRHSGLFGEVPAEPLLYLTLAGGEKGLREALFESPAAAAAREALEKAGREG